MNLGKGFCLFVLLFGLWGCAGDSDWQTTDVSGLLPDFELSLEDPQGTTVDEESLSGQVVLLFFGFTHCPDICPTTLARLGSAIRSLPEADRQQLSIVLVTVDPARDTAERMQAYASAFGDRVVALRTDDESKLKELTRRYRVTYGYGEALPSGEYDVSHSSGVFVFDRQGRARLLVREQDEMAALVADLRQLLEEPAA